MRPILPLQPALPETWAHVLDEVDATLRKAETAAAERGQVVSNFAPSTAADKERVTLWQQNLERLEERIHGWPTILQRAEKEASNADVVLLAPEEPLRRWLSEADALGQRLAKWVEPGV